MNRIFATICMAGLLLLGAAPTIHANPPDPQNYFGTGSTNGNNSPAWAIVSANSISGGSPVVTAIDADADTPNTAQVNSYLVTEQTVCAFTNSTVSIPVTSTNTGTKWDSGTVVIRHLYNDTYEKRSLATSGGATNLEVTAATLGTVAPGDIIYKVSTNGAPFLLMETNTVGANRMWIRRYGNGPLLVGQRGKPLLIEAGAGGNTATIRNVSGFYSP